MATLTRSLLILAGMLWLSTDWVHAAQPKGATLSANGEPVTIHAEQMAYAGTEGRVTFRGKVRVAQGELNLSADHLVVTLDGTNGNARGIRKMVANGAVQFGDGLRQGRAQQATYDPAAGTVVLTGQASLKDATMNINGRRIKIDLNSGESTVEGGVFTFTEAPDNGALNAP